MQALNIIDLSRSADPADDFATFLDQLCARLELDFASFAMLDPFSGSVHGYANYPGAWKSHYMAEGFQNIDPIVQNAGRSIAPVDWRRFSADPGFQRVMRAGADFGIPGQGLTVPVRGPFGECGLLSVARAGKPQHWDRQRAEIVGRLQLAAVHLHDAVMQGTVLGRALGRPQLSSREIEILQWTAAGKQQQDIGDILSISSRTVEVHLRSAREKLGALTTAQAVGRAIGMRLIYPS